MRIKYSKNEFELAVKNSLSKAETCRLLGIRPSGGNYKTINMLIKLWGVDTSHFTGQGWNVGLKFKPNKTKPLNEILVKDISYNSHKLKLRLISEGIKKHECEKCGLTNWLGEKIKLELHHVNGNNIDNRLENIQLLCPNCHSFTDNFRKGKSALLERKEVEYRKVKEALTSNVDGNLEPSEDVQTSLVCAETIHGKSKAKKHTCKHCEQFFSGKLAKFCSVDCYREYNRKNIPKVPELLLAFEKLKYFSKVGELYSVSDNAVKKWCEHYGILEMIKK